MTPDGPAPAATCCRRPMSTIAVTSPLTETAGTLALHTCSACGRHLWERDGAVLERDEVLAVVKGRIAEGPRPKVPAPRRERAARPAPAPAPARPEVPADVQARLAGFTVHGAPRT